MPSKLQIRKTVPMYSPLWSTHHEKEFIDGLGTFHRNALPRIVLLAKYINYMSTVRQVFGAIKKDEAIEYAKEQLKILEKK